MITLRCEGGCDAPPGQADIPHGLTPEKYFERVAREGFEHCDHCLAYFHRIQCFTFHKAPTDRPVPFTSKAAERMERRRLTRLEAA
jgi:hypothetical protein